MLKSGLFSLVAVLVLAVAGRAALPPEASKLLEDYQKATDEARKKFEDQERQSRAKLAEALEKILKRFIDAGMLDEAVAVKEEIQRLRADVGKVKVNVKPEPFPGTVPGAPENVGKSFVYEVTGEVGGSVWGTDVYTTDSSLAAAAVHAGAVQVGQKGVVRVTILAGQQAYQGSTRNGVTTHAWNAYPTSYRVEAVR